MGFDFTKFEEKKETTRRILTPEEIKKRAEDLKQKNSKEDVKDSVKEEKKDDTKELNKSNVKKNDKTKSEKNKENKIEDTPIVYSRPRSVFAYGEEIYTENDVNVSLEGIRYKLANEYGFSEFRDKEKCTIIFNAKTGEVYPEIKFQKKG